MSQVNFVGVLCNLGLYIITFTNVIMWSSIVYYNIYDHKLWYLRYERESLENPLCCVALSRKKSMNLFLQGVTKRANSCLRQMR